MTGLLYRKLTNTVNHRPSIRVSSLTELFSSDQEKRNIVYGKPSQEPWQICQFMVAMMRAAELLNYICIHIL